MEDEFNLGTYVKLLRKDKRYTLKDLSNATGISTSQLSKIERNTCSPEKRTVISLAKGLGISPDTILYMSGIPVRNSEEIIQYLGDIIVNRFSGKKSPGIKGLLPETLLEVILGWVQANESELSEKEIQLLAEEMEDFYNSRVRRMVQQNKDRNL